jgi:hypothetical protein
MKAVDRWEPNQEHIVVFIVSFQSNIYSEGLLERITLVGTRMKILRRQLVMARPFLRLICMAMRCNTWSRIYSPI